MLSRVGWAGVIPGGLGSNAAHTLPQKPGDDRSGYALPLASRRKEQKGQGFTLEMTCSAKLSKLRILVSSGSVSGPTM
ncbi:Uncharacterised protein [Mycobacteroides abscessus subsp. bolletii]|nr:Uncharacterised protein [Mycobacteroides abscessus]SKF61681.1 Uncharacterised protein [Mycobacteroides abscessus subsp. bolletii]SKH84439.1 Uncharacterised protein [Mycobacteroides abscessus subsp. bolletii]SLI51719.1 Uncharacterised protein [Mycobacteroides abscessus subsp. bolletii]